jgi:hypothetical protein
MADKYNGQSQYGKIEQKPQPRYCGSCISGSKFYDENYCPDCWTVPGKPHFRRKGHSEVQESQMPETVRYRFVGRMAGVLKK